MRDRVFVCSDIVKHLALLSVNGEHSLLNLVLIRDSFVDDMTLFTSESRDVAGNK